MARFIYKGKKEKLEIPLPSETITVKPNGIFEAKSNADKRFMKALMARERLQCDDMYGWAFMSADEHELATIDESEEQDSELTTESDSELASLSFDQLKEIAKEKGIKPGRVSKEKLREMIETHGEKPNEDTEQDEAEE